MKRAFLTIFFLQLENQRSRPKWFTTLDSASKISAHIRKKKTYWYGLTWQFCHCFHSITRKVLITHQFYWHILKERSPPTQKSWLLMGAPKIEGFQCNFYVFYSIPQKVGPPNKKWFHIWILVIIQWLKKGPFFMCKYLTIKPNKFVIAGEKLITTVKGR